MPRKTKQIAVLLTATEISRLLLVSQKAGVRVPTILRSAINYYLGRRMLEPEVPCKGGGRPQRSRVRPAKRHTTLPAGQVVARLQASTTTSSISASAQRNTES